jgi:tRNA A-37 threonylcarbamoyl transferase component Bud32
MHPVTKEIAMRYLSQIEPFGVTTPEIMDAVLRGNELTIVLVDGRKLKFNTDEQPAARQPREVSKPFAYIEEEVEAIQAETKPKKGKAK